MISLPQSKDRRESVKEELKKVNMDFEFFDAVDGHKNYEELRNHYKKIGVITERAYNEFSPGALGCLLSHHKIFEREHKLQGDEKYWILIMEDDIKFAPNIYEKIHNYIDHWPKDTKIVKLGYWNNYTKGYKQECGNPYFLELKKQTCSTLCYAIHSDLFVKFVNHNYSGAIDTIVDYPMYGFKTPTDVPIDFYKLSSVYDNAVFEGICNEKFDVLPSIIGYHRKNKVIHIGTSHENTKRIKLDRIYNDRTLICLEKSRFPDKFLIHVQKDELVVKRTDSSEGWGFPYKVTLIDDPPKFYISMTTIPSRFKNLPKTIDSLVNQSYPPVQIILNIPKQYGFRFKNQSIPQENIEQLQQKYGKKLRINMIEKDYGPGSKLLGALECNDISDDSYIILVDDDVIYCDFLKDYCIGVNEHAVFSSCVCDHEDIDLKIGQGVNAFLIKKQLLSKFQRFYNIIKDNELLNYHDDMYISYYLKLIGEKIIQLNSLTCIKEHSDTPDPLFLIRGEFCRYNALYKGYAELVNMTKDHKFDFLTA